MTLPVFGSSPYRPGRVLVLLFGEGAGGAETTNIKLFRRKEIERARRRPIFFVFVSSSPAKLVTLVSRKMYLHVQYVRSSLSRRTTDGTRTAAQQHSSTLEPVRVVADARNSSQASGVNMTMIGLRLRSILRYCAVPMRHAGSMIIMIHPHDYPPIPLAARYPSVKIAPAGKTR